MALFRLKGIRWPDETIFIFPSLAFREISEITGNNLSEDEFYKEIALLLWRVAPDVHAAHIHELRYSQAILEF